MTARLQRQIGRRVPGMLRSLVERSDLRVVPKGIFMPTPSHNLGILNDHATDARIRARQPQALLRKRERLLHEFAVICVKHDFLQPLRLICRSPLQILWFFRQLDPDPVHPLAIGVQYPNTEAL